MPSALSVPPVVNPPRMRSPPRGVAHAIAHVDETFLAYLDERREATPVSLASGNMRANRRFLRDAALAAEVCARLPASAGVRSVCSDLRFIEYDEVGGFIAPHVDGSRVCAHTGRMTTHSFLLYLSDVPEEYGGETDFLESVEDENSVVYTVVPRRGTVVVFPHDTPHVGRCVDGRFPKILLRGDCVVEASDGMGGEGVL